MISRYNLKYNNVFIITAVGIKNSKIIIFSWGILDTPTETSFPAGVDSDGLQKEWGQKMISFNWLDNNSCIVPNQLKNSICRFINLQFETVWIWKHIITARSRRLYCRWHWNKSISSASPPICFLDICTAIHFEFPSIIEGPNERTNEWMSE